VNQIREREREERVATSPYLIVEDAAESKQAGRRGTGDTAIFAASPTLLLLATGVRGLYLRRI
jgi:hypothetical protein